MRADVLNMKELLIEPIPVKKLHEFAEIALADRARYEILPIDPIRAAAQSNNPVADGDDAGLMVAYYEGKCVGHQGLIPIELSLDGKLHKIIATVALFIEKDFRGKRTTDGLTVAEAIYRKSLDLGFDVMNTGFGRARERLHERRPEWFVQTRPLDFCQTSFSLLQPFSTSFRKLGVSSNNSPLKVFHDFAQSKLERPFMGAISTILGTKKNNASLYRVHAVERIVPVSGVSAVRKGVCYLPRSVETLNWMTSSPWHPTGVNPYPRCYFCNSRQKFRFYPFQIYRGTDEPVGYFILSLSTEQEFTTLKILDYDFNNPSIAGAILNYAIKFGLINSCNLLEYSRSFYPLIESNWMQSRLTRIAKRPYWFALQPESPLTGRLGEFEPDYCDGERPFL